MSQQPEKKKVICLIECLESGGAQRQLIGLASMLKEKGYDVTVATYYNNEFYKPLLDTCDVGYHLICDGGNKLSMLRAFWKYLHSASPDYVISFSETSSMIACAMRPFLNTQLVVSERNNIINYTFSDRLRIHLYRFADKIVSNSYSQGKFIEKHASFLAKKSSVIVNFVDTDTFSPIPDACQHDDTTRLICVARVTPQKNMERLIEALKMIRDDGWRLKFDWYGNTTDPYAAHCASLIQQHSLGDMLRIHQPANNIHYIYPRYDALCLPSIHEGTPNVVAEAMSCELPILCGDVCDNRLIVGDSGNLLFDPYSPDDIKNQLEAFCRLSQESRQQIGKANRKRALDMFSKEKFIDRYLQLLSPCERSFL